MSTDAGQPTLDNGGSDGSRPRLEAADALVTSRSLRNETLAVLGVCLGASALSSLIDIINRLTYVVPLNRQVTRMNNSVTPDRPWLDLAYQLMQVFRLVAPVFLVIYLLGHLARPYAASAGASARHYLGLDGRDLGRDLLWGFGLAAAIGIPGLGLYLAAKAAGLNTQIAAANLAGAWWTVPMLVLLSAANALLEETVMIGYLLTRWRQAGWAWWPAIAVSAVIRGAYHLYQGFGGFIGNLLMGLLFGHLYRRRPRVLPLVIAHTVIDCVAFIGYSYLRGKVSWL